MNQRHVYLYSSLYVVLDRFINIICQPTWAGVTQAIYIDRSPCPASAPNQFHCFCYVKKIYRPEMGQSPKNSPRVPPLHFQNFRAHVKVSQYLVGGQPLGPLTQERREDRRIVSDRYLSV